MSERGGKDIGIQAALCVAGAIAAYIGALKNGFVWDDIYLVVKNPYIKGFGNIPTLFTTGYWASIGQTGGLYRPLTMLSFLLENSVAGAAPFLYHLDNVALHAASTLLVYLIARKLVSADSVAPLFSGLLFALHPAHVEAVSWVSGRAELLSTFAVLLGYHIFISRPRKAGWVGVTVLIFLAGVLCKETAVMLPAVITLHLLVIERVRDVKRIVRGLWPYAAMFSAYLPLRMYVLGGHVGPQSQMFGNVSGPDVLLAMMEAGFHYVRLSLFPVDLKVAYIFPPPPVYAPRVITFAVIIVIAAIFVRKYHASRPLPVLLLLWSFVTLLPVSNIVPTEVIMTERALYLPSAGFCILAGLAFTRVYAASRAIGLTAVLAVALAFTALVVYRTPVWGSDRLFQEELLDINKGLVEDFPDQPAAYVKLADSYVALGDMLEAGPLYAKALELDPADCEAHYGRGNTYKNAGRLDNALDELYDALDCGYEFPADIHGNIANILYEMGDLSASEEHLKIAIELDPYEPKYPVNMGYIYRRRGDLKAAIDITRKAADMDPSNFMAHYRLGMLYGEEEDFQDAVKWLREAVALSPDNLDARFYLGAAYEAAGNIDDAVREYSAIIKIAPGHEAAGARLKLLEGR